MAEPLNLLIIEDSEDDALLLLRELRHGGFQLVWERVETSEALRTALQHQTWDVIISDYHLPTLNAPTALEIVKQSQPDLPFIVVSGTIGETAAVEMMRQGANDYLMKGSLVRLAEAIRREMRESEIRRERLRSRLELERTQERLQLAIENSGLGLWDWWIQTGAVTLDDRWAEILGYTPDELQPISIATWLNNLHPEDLPRANLGLEKHFRRETETYECELRMRHKLGAWVWVLCKGKVMEWDDSGNPVRMIGTHMDITGRKQNVEMLLKLNETLEDRVKSRTIQLKQSEASLREAQQIAHLGSWELDVQSRKFSWSAEVFRIFGLDSDLPEPSYGQMLNYLVMDDRDRFIQLIDRAITEGTNDETDLQIIRDDGSSGYIFVKLEVIKDESDQVIRVFGIAMDISDRKQAELQKRQLLQELSAFKLALDQTAIIANTDARGVITYVNDYFCRISGYSREELVGQTHRIIKSGYHPHSFFQDMWLTISRGEIWRGEICNRHKNGSLYWVESTIVPFVDPQGRPFQYLAIRYDITARKLAQANLQQENIFRQQIMENMAEGLCVCYEIEEFPFLHFTVWNQQMQLITGYSLAEINQFGWEQSLNPVSQRQSQESNHLNMSSPAEHPIHEEWEIQHKDGRKLTIAMSRSVLSSDDGKSYLLALLQDITDRKQAELKLKQQSTQEHLLSSITKRMRLSLDLDEILNAAVGEIHQILELDRVLVYRVFSGGTGAAIAESVSPNWPKILDIVFPEEVFPEQSYERYVQGRIYTLSDREDPQQFISPNLANFLAEIHVRAKLVVPIIQQQKLWGLLIAHQCDRPRQWQDWEIDLLKQVASQLAIAVQQTSLFEQLQQELSVRQQAEAQLTESNQQLAISNEELIRATRMKDEFLANMSHELRTPLNAILGMTEGLKEGVFGIVGDRQIKALQTVYSSGTHLLELINDILDVAKIESGQVTLELTNVSITNLCQSSIAFIKQQASAKKIQVIDKIPPYLPELMLDERRIRQVLINLLNNAVKFTPEGGTITLEVSSYIANSDIASSEKNNAEDVYLRIAVIDTGIGISAKNIQKLFQPFIQIDSALNRQYVGTGLGLALVKRIVELHGGKVGLTSEVGVGSHFMIDLPSKNSSIRSLPSSSELVTNADVISSAIHSESTTSPLILLADDNEANTSTIVCYLEAKGYRLLLAQNGQEAIAIAKAQHPDLILMDIQMPVIDGLEAIRQIRLDPHLLDVPIIALTALAMIGDRERCLAVGANEYIAKPVKLKQLASTMQLLLKN
ncbi:PAS domain-containing protein [Pseudanabaena sp. ABRG5-3]|uniref:PAS domain-containing protein n=1 Tax=Pseudanabaena sp. ABRG5-3 TaxID=685565 RepID=UPI000DC733CC|nr:PAS domain-containing protein [Pseudanabaena sp. ABRG5-3]BBC25931.1 multi-sensor hybrid histidine kinase [Pseudanabaena sp. ABRG5-3]